MSREALRRIPEGQVGSTMAVGHGEVVRTTVAESEEPGSGREKISPGECGP